MEHISQLYGERTMTHLKQLVKELPLNLQREVEDFARFLLEKRHEPQAHHFLLQNWGGGLREFRDQYSALQLQQQALVWRGNSSWT